MATLTGFEQHFFDVKNGELTIGFHRVTLQSIADQFTVPTLANSTSGNSVSQLLRNGDSSATVANSDAFTVTIVGAVGQDVTIVTLHEGMVNSWPDA